MIRQLFLPVFLLAAFASGASGEDRDRVDFQRDIRKGDRAIIDWYPLAGQTLTWNDNWLVAPGSTSSLTFQAQASTTPGIYFNEATLRVQYKNHSIADVLEIPIGPPQAEHPQSLPPERCDLDIDNVGGGVRG